MTDRLRPVQLHLRWRNRFGGLHLRRHIRGNDEGGMLAPVGNGVRDGFDPQNGPPFLFNCGQMPQTRKLSLPSPLSQSGRVPVGRAQVLQRQAPQLVASIAEQAERRFVRSE